MPYIRKIKVVADSSPAVARLLLQRPGATPPRPSTLVPSLPRAPTASEPGRPLGASSTSVCIAPDRARVPVQMVRVQPLVRDQGPPHDARQRRPPRPEPRPAASTKRRLSRPQRSARRLVGVRALPLGRVRDGRSDRAAPRSAAVPDAATVGRGAGRVGASAGRDVTPAQALARGTPRQARAGSRTRLVVVAPAESGPAHLPSLAVPAHTAEPVYSNSRGTIYDRRILVPAPAARRPGRALALTRPPSTAARALAHALALAPTRALTHWKSRAPLARRAPSPRSPVRRPPARRDSRRAPAQAVRDGRARLPLALL